jgi:hypothetical protein
LGRLLPGTVPSPRDQQAAEEAVCSAGALSLSQAHT